MRKLQVDPAKNQGVKLELDAPSRMKWVQIRGPVYSPKIFAERAEAEWLKFSLQKTEGCV